MTHRASANATTHRTIRPAVVGLTVATAVVIGMFVVRPASSAPSAEPSSAPSAAPPAAPSAAPPGAPSLSEAAGDEMVGPATEADGAVTEVDGLLPARVSVFDDGYPGVADLDPDLLRALRDAATAAADDGVAFQVNSGWRSADYQNQLIREAVVTYGSEAEAARWVATVDTSAHVSGNAVDIGSVDATAWLAEHGAAYGLCQIYGNESWHFELRPEAIDRGCPSMYADPTHDPRMQHQP